MPKKEYSNGTATAKLKTWDNNERAYSFENDKGELFLARKGSKIPKDYKFNYKDTYKIEIGKEKNVGNVWYINTVTNLTGSDATPSKGGSVNGYDSEGQERGNYRTNLTTFINAFVLMGKTATEADVTVYNSLLKFGESQALAKAKVEVNKPTDTLTKVVPQEGTGVISEASATDIPVEKSPF